MERIDFNRGEIYFYNKHNQVRTKISMSGLTTYIYDNDETKVAFCTNFTPVKYLIAPLFVISSVSASGKTTIVDSIISKIGMPRLVTTTTRKIREGETGSEYNFVDETKFKQMMEVDNFIEHACVYGNFYGLSKHELVKSLDTPRIIILDVKGYNTIKSIYPNTIGVFILPPERTELERRLNERNGDPVDIAKRLSEMDDELLNVDKYDFTIKNGDLDGMICEMFNIITESI